MTSHGPDDLVDVQLLIEARMTSEGPNGPNISVNLVFWEGKEFGKGFFFFGESVEGYFCLMGISEGINECPCAGPCSGSMCNKSHG
jgi:hypothetical protein